MFPFDKAVYFAVTFPLSDNPYALLVTQGATVQLYELGDSTGCVYLNICS